MIRTVESRRRRLHLELGAALLGWNHERLAEEGLSSPLPLEQALGIRTTLNGHHFPVVGEGAARTDDSPVASPSPSLRSGKLERPVLCVAFSTHGTERWCDRRHVYVEPVWHVTATLSADLELLTGAVVESDEDGERALEGEELAAALEVLDDRICKAAKGSL